MPDQPTHLARLSLDQASARALANSLGEILDAERATLALFEQPDGRWAVELHFAEPPDEPGLRALVRQIAGEAAAAALCFATVAARDWVKQSLADLKPVLAGRFVVHGAHDRARVPLNTIAIEIEAALAFGTGHHGTTRGCLLALDAVVKRGLTSPRQRGEVGLRASLCERRNPGERARPRVRPSGQAPSPALLRARALARRPRIKSAAGSLPASGERSKPRILDLGTGSGVLAIAAAKALRAPATASDIDRVAVKAAKENARLNRTRGLTIVLAAGLASPHLQAGKPYDLIFGNILLAPLKRLAQPLKQVLAPGGRIILSGLLTSQANAGLSAYRRQGLVLERRITLDNWTTLVMRRAGA